MWSLLHNILSNDCWLMDFEFGNGCVQIVVVDGLEQVVDRVEFEGAQGIVVEGCCENNGTLDVYFFKNLER